MRHVTLPMLAVWACVALAACAPPLPRSPLFEGVESQATSEAGAQLVKSRIEQRWPVGSPEAGLADYLRSQGLKVERMTDAGAPGQPILGKAATDLDPPGCTRVLSVHWRGDTQGRMSELHVNFGDSGCL
jgi:hypothetical protein